MTHAKLIPSRLRLKLAGMTALAGGIVSVAMVIVGGPMARFLPSGDGFHLAALVGAGCAGFFCAGGFGRAGRRGWMMASLVAVVATVTGAIVGSTLIGVTAGTVTGSGMGLLAILDASSSPAAVGIWGATMALLHIMARAARRRAALSL